MTWSVAAAISEISPIVEGASGGLGLKTLETVAKDVGVSADVVEALFSEDPIAAGLGVAVGLVAAGAVATAVTPEVLAAALIDFGWNEATAGLAANLASAVAGSAIARSAASVTTSTIETLLPIANEGSNPSGDLAAILQYAASMGQIASMETVESTAQALGPASDPVFDADGYDQNGYNAAGYTVFGRDQYGNIDPDIEAGDVHSDMLSDGSTVTVILRIGSSKGKLHLRLRAWRSDVSRAVNGDYSRTPRREAEIWRSTINEHGSGNLYAREGSVVTTPVGEFNLYQYEERALIDRYRPRCCNDVKMLRNP